MATQSALLAGKWNGRPPEPIERLSTLTLGLIGLGRIGRKFSELMQPMVKRILFHDPAVPGSVPLETVLREADLLSLHCPLLPATRHLINAATLKMVKPTALLLNVSRGALLEPVAVAQAVREGRLAGIGVDVFEPEVLPAESPLRTLGDRAILTSHTAWYSRQSSIDCRTQAIQKLIARLSS
jgi:D-3-phosphoglycerate dehydrogenase